MVFPLWEGGEGRRTKGKWGEGGGSYASETLPPSSNIGGISHSVSQQDRQGDRDRETEGERTYRLHDPVTFYCCFQVGPDFCGRCAGISSTAISTDLQPSALHDLAGPDTSGETSDCGT